MQRRRWLFRLMLFTGLICVVAACTQAFSPQVAPTPTTQFVLSTITATQPPAPPATATPLGGSSTLLRPLPYNCPVGPKPQAISAAFGPAAGANPVWVGAGNFRPQTPLALIWDAAEVQSGPEHNQYGWNHKFLYVVATSYQGIVTIHGTNLNDGSPVYLSAQDAVTTGESTSLVMDTRSPTIVNRNDKWTQFPGALTVPKAGCYSLKAAWSGGSWRMTFAAGVAANSG
jgi:hypothetical protein